MIFKVFKIDYFPIRWKLINYSLILIALVIFVALYVSLGLKLTVQFYQGSLNEYQYLETLKENLRKVEFYTERYLTDDSELNLKKAQAANVEIEKMLKRMNGYLRMTDQKEKYYSYFDLERLLNKFRYLNLQTLETRKKGFLEIAYDYNDRLGKMEDLINKYLTKLIYANANWENEKFYHLMKKTKRIEQFTYLLAVIIGVLSIIYCINFALGITKPLEQMVFNAEQIAAGDFLVKRVAANSRDELEVITQIFNRMSQRIHEMFVEIQAKAKLEDELKEEKLHNLEIQNLLRESELQVLQAQINPHFLFNTLNAISQVAILEDADETGELIKAVARLLRYNLRSLDAPVTLKDEINHLKEYLYIMKVRYGNKIQCYLEVEAKENYLIPNMTLQPLMENAYLHGFVSFSQQKNEIYVQIKVREARLEISITDNGVGISKTRLAEIIARDLGNKKESTPDNHNGLGLVNIWKRLEHFYHCDDLFEIKSELGKGTQIILRLPLIEEAY